MGGGARNCHRRDTIFWAVTSVKESGRGRCRASAAPPAHHTNGSGNLLQAPQHGCTIARAIPPPWTIAPELSLRGGHSIGGSGERAASLVLFTSCRWCECASAHAGFPARDGQCSALANGCWGCWQCGGAVVCATCGLGFGGPPLWPLGGGQHDEGVDDVRLLSWSLGDWGT